MEQKSKRKSIIIEVPEEVIKGTFILAIREAEALNDFYITFRDTWQKNKLEFEEQHKIAIRINELILEILSSENHNDKYEEIKNTIIADSTFADIIELTFKEDKNGIDDAKNSMQLSYSLKGKYSKSSIYDPQMTHSEYAKLEKQYDIFVRSILTNIVIIFERYFAKILEFMVVLQPESYFEGKTIKVSELLFSHPMQLISNEVQNFVDSNMFDIIKILDTMKDKSKFDIDRHLKIRDEFEEIYYRRNIFVHNSGIVNDIYLENISEKYRTNLKNEERLICDDIYLENSLCILKKVICSCYYEFIICSDIKIDLYETLSEEVVFKALCNKEYDFCRDIYNILSKDKRINFAEKTMYHVNYMIALKQEGNSIEKMLNEFDVSAMAKQFKLAKECLSENHQNVYDILSSMYPSEMGAEAIRDWPLFIDFRKSQEYEKFKSEHIDDFNQYIFEEQDKRECEADIFEWDHMENLGEINLGEVNSLEQGDIKDPNEDKC